MVHFDGSNNPKGTRPPISIHEWERGRSPQFTNPIDPRPLVLLQTKFAVPRVDRRSGLLSRSRLVDSIRDIDLIRLVVVSAPAGFGKTTVVAQAVNGLDSRLSWLSLDERDNEPARFVAYLVNALGHSSGAAVTSSDGFATQDATVWELLDTAINELASAVEPVTLVIDDYHLIRNPVVHQLMDHLVDFLPPTLRLILISRNEPPLRLARLRVRGELLELRADDLCFTREETARYLADGENAWIRPGAIATIHTKTEGWIVALHLLRVLLRQEPNDRREAILDHFAGSRRDVAQFLLDEILGYQSPERRDFLLRSSILSRVTGLLCDAVTGHTDSQSTLRALEHEGMLVFALDNQRRWYRFHNLLSEYLVQQLTDEIGVENVADLHRRASTWLSESGQLHEAVDHSLAAGDWERAVWLIRQIGLDATAVHQSLMLRRWLDLLPESVRDDDPELVYWHGHACMSTCQPRRGSEILERAEHAMSSSDHQLLIAGIRSTRAWCAIYEGRIPEGLELATSAVELNANGSDDARANARIALATALLRMGKVYEARSHLDRAEAIDPLPKYAFVEAGRAFALEGHFAEAEEKIRFALTNENHTDAHRRGYIWLSSVYRNQNRLDGAAELLDRAEELSEYLVGESFLPALGIARARWIAASGDVEGALLALDRCIDLTRRAGLEITAREAEAIRAGIHLRLGEIARVTAWVEDHHLESGPSLPDYLYIEEQIVFARYVALTGRPEAGLNQLVELRRSAADDGRVIDAGRIAVIESSIYHAQRRPDLAYATLKTAVDLLAPCGSSRVFIDELPELAAPLRSVAASGHHLDFIRTILATESATPEVDSTTTVDSLSSRELEVLRLVSLGLSNKEIADQLFITVPTAKRHISTILDKLDAKSRTQAVNIAQSLELL